VAVYTVLLLLGCATCIRIFTPLGITVYSQIYSAPESNPRSDFGDFLNRKKLVYDSNPHLSFNRPLPTGRLIE